MASLHRTPGSKTWACCFTLPDGRRAMRSTSTKNRTKALEICAKMAASAELAHSAKLTEDRARKTIADIYNLMSDDRIGDVNIRSYLDSWLQRKKLEVAESSLVEYQRLAKDFIAFLGAKADRNMDALTHSDLVRYRTTLATKVSAGTINKNLKALRGAWTQAVKDGLITRNVFADIGLVRDSNAARRRPLTIDELHRLLEVADTAWRGVILAALYTGQRLHDIITLKWSQVDLAEGMISFHTQKTGSDLVLPIAPPLHAHLMEIAGKDDAKAYLFPDLATLNGTTQSARFTALLEKAGIISLSKEEKQHTAKGTNGRRESKGVSFHSLRHTATSLLKNAGVSDVVAREIIGHKSEAVSRLYTHIEAGTLKAAVARMPDITKP